MSMTEQERVDKLKARMSRWQAYVDHPPSNTREQTTDVVEREGEGHQGRTVRRPEMPQPGLLLEPARRTPTGRRDIQANAPVPEPLTAMQEARIADLKIAIAREREQADRLADEVKRAQALHAATIYAHLADEKVRKAEPLSIHQQIPEEPPVSYDDAQRKTQVLVFGLLLAITSVLVVTFFLTR